MNACTVSPLLRFALRLDAIASAGTGIAMAAFDAQLAALLALPQALLFGAGLFCVVYGAVIAMMSTQVRLPCWAVWTVIVGNAIWATECLVLAFSGLLDPNALGVAFLAGQGVLVFVFAELQYVGMRRAGTDAVVSHA